MKSFIKILIALMALLLVMTGCEWDGPTAMYNQPQPEYPIAKITEINPDVARAGENYITIVGENFAPSLTDNMVFFDNAMVDLIDGSTTALTVRRPNRSGDAITVKVVSYGTLVVAEYSPYKIDPVITQYGNILAGNDPIALAVDQNENVYLMFRTSGVTQSAVQKFTPDGERVDIGMAPVFAGDARIAPDGNLTYFRNNNKIIRQMNVTTGVSDTLVAVSKNVSFGDYDEYGNLYVGGNKSDLIIVNPDLTQKNAGFYAKDAILYIRCFNGYVYILAQIATPAANTPAQGIFKHQIMDAAGSLGPQEVVLDWATTGEHAESLPSSFAFSSAGMLYVGSDNANPLLKVDVSDGKIDIMYKQILSSSVLGMDWGAGNYLYYIKGPYGVDATSTLMRIDMGEPGL